MAVKIDYLIQDSEALIKVVNANRTAMNAKGFTETNYNSFVEDQENLKAKELAQQRAVKFVSDLGESQNSLVSDVCDLLKMVRNSARSAYGNDERNLKLFKIGEAIPVSVKKLRAVCEYSIALVEEKKEVLFQNGITQENIADLKSSFERLISTDAERENAKKMQKAATESRDDAAEKLKEKMFRIRSFAKVCFVGNNEVLIQFNSITKGAGGKKSGGSDEQTPENNQPQNAG